MNARADKTDTGDIAALMRAIGTRARAAARVLALADSSRKEKEHDPHSPWERWEKFA